jgi:hypothetical protein
MGTFLNLLFSHTEPLASFSVPESIRSPTLKINPFSFRTKLRTGDLDAFVLTYMEVVGVAGIDFLYLGQSNLLIKTGQSRVGILDRREMLVPQSR